jgi:hypothetical protein
MAVVARSSQRKGKGGSKPGERRGGRQKGTPNKTTAALKDAILTAAELCGADGKGKDGTVGYLTYVAKTDVKAFAGLLGKVLPLQLAGKDGEPVGFRKVIIEIDDASPSSGR